MQTENQIKMLLSTVWKEERVLTCMSPPMQDMGFLSHGFACKDLTHSIGLSEY